AFQHGLGHINVGRKKSIQRIADHADAELRHAGNIDVQSGIRPGQEIHNPLSDVDRLIAHAFQVSVDFDAGDDEAQVDSHRLLHGEQVNGHFIHIAFSGIDLEI